MCIQLICSSHEAYFRTVIEIATITCDMIARRPVFNIKRDFFTVVLSIAVFIAFRSFLIYVNSFRATRTAARRITYYLLNTGNGI